MIVDSIPAGIAVLAADGEVEAVNSHITEYFGKGTEELKGWVTANLVHADDIQRVVESFKQSVGTGEPYEIEARLLGADGSYRWFQIRGLPLRDPSGCIIRWYALHIDIDERKRAEQALRESEVNLRKIINTIPTTAWSTRPDGYCDFLNDRWLHYAGFTAEQAEGWAWAEAIHPDDAKGLAEYWKSHLASGAPVDTEARIRRFDREYRWFLFLANPLHDESGNIIRWYGTNIDIDDRKRAEQALAESERQLRLVLNTIPGLVAVFTASGEPEGLNEQFLQYLGQSLEQFEQWSTNGTVHPDDLARHIGALTRSLKTGQPIDFETRLRRFDGMYRWFQLRGNPARDSEGRIVRWYCLMTDVDDRRRAEDALRESERQSRLIVDSVDGMIALFTPDGELDGGNQQLLTYFHQPLEAVKHWATNTMIHPDDLQRTVDNFRRSIGSGTPHDFETRFLRFDGVYRWFQIRGLPLRDADGLIIRWYVLLTDIDDRKRAEEELRRSEAFLAEGQHLARMGNFSWHVSRAEMVWSEQLFRIFDLQPGTHVTFELIASRVHPEDTPMLGDMIERAQRGEDDVEYRLRIVMPDQSTKHLHLIAHGTRNLNGETEYIGAVLDITQQRLSEEALEKVRSELGQAMRIMSLGALTASIAHEVNQPLSGIITNAGTCLRMLADDPPNLEGARETARRTIRDGNRAAEVITRLRALFSKRAATMKPVDLQEAVREVIALSWGELERNKILLRTKFANRLPLVAGDRVQLQQVIMNLLRNAADAMTAVSNRPRQVTIATEFGDEGHIRLSVHDAGVGFGPQDIERIFEAFYTTKINGMGIGLSVSRSIIESHRGRLWAEANSDGPGATFYFSIPEFSGD